jgi:hypothetical protein
MLYMKTRVTFRVAPDLAGRLRSIPNQTAFVEAALREALLAPCAACGGTGRRAPKALRVANARAAGITPLSRAAALQLRQLVRLARRVSATSVDVERDGSAVRFQVRRDHDVLLRGALADGHTLLDG